jgi:hypothetical protein
LGTKPIDLTAVLTLRKYGTADPADARGARQEQGENVAEEAIRQTYFACRKLIGGGASD